VNSGYTSHKPNLPHAIRAKLHSASEQFAEALFWVPSKVSSLLSKCVITIPNAYCLTKNPILALGSKDSWDEMGASWASTMLNLKSDWRMYYTGKDRYHRMRIGLAFSNDGFHWAKYGNNPILNIGPPSSWDSYLVYCPVVWKEGNSWKMLFTGCDSPSNMHFQVGLAESDDGITWRKSNRNPVFDDTHKSTVNHFGQHETEAWGFLHEEDNYYLFYSSITRKPRQVYVAQSSDLMAWKAISDRPVLPSEGSPWSLGYMKYCGWPFRYEKDWYLLAAMSNRQYTKSVIGLWKLQGAVSSISPKFIGYLADTSSQWCKNEVEAPFAIHKLEERKILCYYGGRSKNVWAEGLAIFDTEIFRARGIA
jgi:predicted GH43/DUF377 family glycosyl hydrolase